MKPQTKQVAHILEERGEIDNFWAIDTRLTTRLSAAIHDLRNLNWEIETTRTENKNTHYKLISLPKPKQLSLV
jgi:hypothetical protein